MKKNPPLTFGGKEWNRHLLRKQVQYKIVELSFVLSNSTKEFKTLTPLWVFLSRSSLNKPHSVSKSQRGSLWIMIRSGQCFLSFYLLFACVVRNIPAGPDRSTNFGDMIIATIWNEVEAMGPGHCSCCDPAMDQCKQRFTERSYAVFIPSRLMESKRYMFTADEMR